MSTSLVSSVFADTSAIGRWNSELQTINKEAVEAINNFVTTADLKGAFEGDKIDGLTDSIDETMKRAIQKHENLMDFSGPFLTEVIAFMERS